MKSFGWVFQRSWCVLKVVGSLNFANVFVPVCIRRPPTKQILDATTLHRMLARFVHRGGSVIMCFGRNKLSSFNYSSSKTQRACAYKPLARTWLCHCACRIFDTYTLCLLFILCTPVPTFQIFHNWKNITKYKRRDESDLMRFAGIFA